MLSIEVPVFWKKVPQYQKRVDGTFGDHCAQCLGKRDAVPAFQDATTGKLSDTWHDERCGITEEDGVGAYCRARLLAQRLQRLTPSPATKCLSQYAKGKRQQHPCPVHLMHHDMLDALEIEIAIHPIENRATQYEWQHDLRDVCKYVFRFHWCKGTIFIEY